jgi:GAF domain-containing protein
VATHGDKLAAVSNTEPLRPVAPEGGHIRPLDWAIGQWRWLVPVTVAAAACAWVAGLVAGRAFGAERLILVGCGALLTSLAAGLPLWQQRLASQARGDAVTAARVARAAMRVALEDALDPFVHLVGRLAEAHGSDKVRLRGEAIQLAVTTVAALAGAQRIRVCLFLLEEGPPRRLHAERFAGRAGPPTPDFYADTGAGGAVLRLLDRRAWTYVEDTAVDSPRIWWDTERAYRTYISGPVATPDDILGLLTLDALTPGELSDVDLTLTRLLADLLATALVI